MKLSKYAFVVKKRDGYVLYNCRTERLIVLEPALADLLRSNDIEILRYRHPDFFSCLQNNEFILEDNENEAERIVEDWRCSDTDIRTFSLFINPTLDCNMRCWYCYEKHLDNSIMSQDVYCSIMRLLHSKVYDGKLEKLHISWFGGEPLLAFDEIVFPLLNDVSNLCGLNNIAFDVSFVTNGTLINDNIIQKLARIGTSRPMLFQISLDGNRDFHNRVKHLDGVGSYDCVLQNIHTILKADMELTLRLNMTHVNIDTFVDIIDDLDNLPESSKKNMIIDIQRVWQDLTSQRSSDFSKKQEGFRDILIRAGYKVNELKHIDPSRCYADKDNCIVVNYNGDLFKCTARDFLKQNREGVLNDDGTLVWNRKRELRDSIKYGNEVCRDCRIYPLCHGGCSQFKMDNIGATGCIRGYSVNFKKKIIDDRIDFLLGNFYNINH